MDSMGVGGPATSQVTPAGLVELRRFTADHAHPNDPGPAGSPEPGSVIRARWAGPFDPGRVPVPGDQRCRGIPWPFAGKEARGRCHHRTL